MTSLVRIINEYGGGGGGGKKCPRISYLKSVQAIVAKLYDFS